MGDEEGGGVQGIVRIYCDGYEEQFRALLIAIEFGQPFLSKSAARKEREMKKLSSSINYDNSGGNDFCAKGRERTANLSL